MLPRERRPGPFCDGLSSFYRSFCVVGVKIFDAGGIGGGEGKKSSEIQRLDIFQSAIVASHPAPDFLAALAKVIVGDASIETLDAFPEWQNV